jgi:hypothetical protein
MAMNILLALVCLTGVAQAASPEETFWKWFAAHADAVGKIKRADEPVADQLAKALHQVDDKLTFELGIGMKPHELIISADGILQVFPAVQKLVAAAPKVPGWKIIAFRPRKQMSEVELGDGTKLRAADMLVETHDAGGKLDVVIHVSGHAADTALKSAVYLLLDSALGEFDTETYVAGIDIVATAPPKTARPLSELARLVDGKKKK